MIFYDILVHKQNKYLVKKCVEMKKAESVSTLPPKQRLLGAGSLHVWELTWSSQVKLYL